jgi:hypothetical protein
VLLGGGMIAQGGKDGNIRLLDWRLMRGVAPHQGRETQVVRSPSNSALFTAPAVSHSGNTTWLFVADNGSTSAWTFTAGALQSAWRNSTGGTSPVVAGRLLYVYDRGSGLHVYQPETGRELAILPTGGGHWNSPIVVDGIVVLPEGNANDHRTTGVIDIFRLP